MSLRPVPAVWFTGICLALLAGCDNGPTDTRAEQAAAYLEAVLVEQDYDAFDEHFSPDATVNGSSLALTILKGTSEGLNQAFPDVSFAVLQQVADSQRVVTHFRLSGTHRGRFNQFAPTQARVAWDGIAIDRFADGRIVESRLFLDLFELGRQLTAAGNEP